VLNVKVKDIAGVCMSSDIMVGAKKLNEKRMTPRRGVVNNLIYCQNQGGVRSARQILEDVT